MDAIWSFLNHNEPVLQKIGWNFGKIVIIFIAFRVVSRLLIQMTHRLLRLHGKMDGRRKDTLEMLFENVIKYTFYFVFLLTVLPIFGIKIGALLAGAGVAGLAIAFAAQSMLKDFVNGFFILFEDQYGIGDHVVINGNWGSVKFVGLRVTSIQAWTGEVITIPNGEIKQVINYSKENSVAVIDVNIGYRTDTEKVIAIIQQVMNELSEQEDNIVGEVSVLGVQELNDSTYTIRATAECTSYTHFGIQRLAKQRLRAAFAEQNVDLPMSKIVYLHENFPEQFKSEPFRLS